MKPYIAATILISSLLTSSVLFSCSSCEQIKTCACDMIDEEETQVATACCEENITAVTEEETQKICACSLATQKPEPTPEPEIEFTEPIEEDEYDMMVDKALENGTLKNEIEFKQPSKLEIFARKAAVMLVVKPYIYMATKYRTAKTWAKLLLKKIWNKEKVA